jgi:putative ABC transport system permease protein
MAAFKAIVMALRKLVLKDAAERELDDEIALHLELETKRNIALGMTPEDAHRQARLAFGPVEAMKESHRDGRGTRLLEESWADVRHALRVLRRNPGLSGAAILTLALGIGANTAIFSAVNTVILRPLPFGSPNRLVMLWEENPDRGWVRQTAAVANFLDWRDQVHAFEGVAAYTDFTSTNTLSGAGEPRVFRAGSVTGDFFRVLGVAAAEGRTFEDAETWDPNDLSAVISDRMWRSEFRADRSIVGHTIELNGRAVRLAGVLPKDFALPGMDVDVWRPMGWDPALRSATWSRRAHWMRPVARLRAGVSLEAANAELQTVVARLQHDFPETNTHMGAGLTPLQPFLVGDSRRPLLVLLSAVGLLLLVACANVGNLLLVQAAGREREVALRLALGARRARLVRQALTESLVLAALGGVAGFALGWWGTLALGALRPAGLLPVSSVGVDWSVLAYVAGITTASGLLFGIAPAIWSGRRVPADALREGGRAGSPGRRQRRWIEGLVVAEIGVALLLSVGAGLLVRSLWRLEQVRPGLDPNGVLTAEITLPGIRYDSAAKIVTFWSQLLEKVRALPGVESAATISQLPLTAPSWSSDFAIAGRGPDEFGTEVVHRVASPGYLEVMRGKLLSGRFFTDADRAGAERVVVINDALAKKYFPREDPVGRRVAFDRVPTPASTWRTIVGVVESERQGAMAMEPRLEFIAPVAQDQSNLEALVVRTRGDPASLAPSVRRAVAELDRNLALASVRPMTEVRADAVARQRFVTTLLLAFAGVGLLLAMIGVYGVMAHLARGRTREIGIRVALGARTAEVQWLVVRRGAALTILGVVGGVAGALVATRALLTLLYEVGPFDTLTFVTVPALLVVASLAACWIPARRASRVDPMESLRAE